MLKDQFIQETTDYFEKALHIKVKDLVAKDEYFVLTTEEKEITVYYPISKKEFFSLDRTERMLFILSAYIMLKGRKD